MDVGLFSPEHFEEECRRTLKEVIAPPQIKQHVVDLLVSYCLNTDAPPTRDFFYYVSSAFNNSRTQHELHENLVTMGDSLVFNLGMFPEALGSRYPVLSVDDLTGTARRSYGIAADVAGLIDFSIVDLMTLRLLELYVHKAIEAVACFRRQTKEERARRLILP